MPKLVSNFTEVNIWKADLPTNVIYLTYCEVCKDLVNKIQKVIMKNIVIL